jgi:molybdate transport system substrate-binding protein
MDAPPTTLNVYFMRNSSTNWRIRYLCVPLGVLLAGVIATPALAQPVELVVSAAASLTDVLTAIGRDYQRKQSGVRLRFNFASSGTLQRQIEQGAPVDLFIAAADKNMDELAARHLIDRKTRRVLAANALVLIVPKESGLSIRRFKDVASAAVTHVAIGGPSVPAGMRAQEVFTRLGIWTLVRRKAVRGKDVREALTQVELGNVEAGVVYRTDAAVSNKVRVVAVAPAAMHKPIRYPLAVTAESEHPAQARAFANYLAGARAKALWRQYRFIVR